jgi:hypothetical protein
MFSELHIVGALTPFAEWQTVEPFNDNGAVQRRKIECSHSLYFVVLDIRFEDPRD